jgi:hypothetical protein
MLWGDFFMLESLVAGLTLIFALIGLLAIIYAGTLKLLSPKKNKEYYLVLPLDNEEESITKICAAIEKRNLLGETHCKIIAVDMGLSFETFKYIERMCLTNKNMELINKADAPTFFEELLHG